MTNTTYDALGRPVRQFAPALEGFQWGFSRPTGWDTRPNTLTEYDMAGRVFRVTEPSGVQTHHYFATDGAGYIVSTVDGRGHATHKVTDGLGRLTRSRTFSGGWNAWTLHAEQRYAYDAMDNLLWTRNEANHATTVSMGYDWLGRKTSMNDPSMGAWTYGYDLNGNLTRQTDARGIVLTFSYDALNRKTAKVQGSTTLASWGYDETNDGLGNTNMQNTRGRLTSTLVNGDNWRRWYYDARGRVIMDRRCVTGSTPDCLFTTQYAYDSADRVTSMTYPNGEVVTTGYNDAMEPVSLAGTSSYVSGATYNALGLLNGMNHGNTTATRLYYYGSNLEHTAAGNSSYGRLRRICVSVNANGCADDANAAGALFKMAYAYDAVGNITNMGDRTLGQGLAYSYDAQDRLTSWSLGGTTQETYSYDVLGRMTNRSTLGTFSYGHASKVHAVTGVGAGTFSYDANGNMLSRWQSETTFTQEWNADNKASRVHGGGQDIRYFYDADGVLVRRTSGGVTTVYVGNHAEWNSSTGWTNYYHFNGQRVAMRNSSGVFWLHGDHLGSASLITTNAGGTSGQLRYDPYGQRRVATGNIWTEYTFTDQRQELSVGLMDYDARLYSPLLARFISPDSIVPDVTNLQDWNRYAYVRHNPMKYVDPSGHIAFIPLLILGAKLAVAGAATSAAVDASIQVAANYQDTGNFASDIGTSASKINMAQVGGAAIGGALTGPILGAGGAAIRSVGFKGIEKAVGYTAYSSLAGAVGSAASTASSTLLAGQNVDYAATYKSALVGSVAGPIGSGIGTGMQRSTGAAINALKSATAQTANVQVPVATHKFQFSQHETHW